MTRNNALIKDLDNDIGLWRLTIELFARIEQVFCLKYVT